MATLKKMTIVSVMLALLMLAAHAARAGEFPDGGCIHDAVIDLFGIIVDAKDAQNEDAVDKLEDVWEKLKAALDKLIHEDNMGAIGELEGAVGDLEAIVKDGFLPPDPPPPATDPLVDLMEALVACARAMAVAAIEEADVEGADGDKIVEAQEALDDGDDLIDPLITSPPKYKDAVAKYKDAKSKAEGAAPAPGITHTTATCWGALKAK